MNEKQYLRANKRVFLAVTIIFAYITLTMLAALAASHGDHFVRIMIQCLVSVGVIILSALGLLAVEAVAEFGHLLFQSSQALLGKLVGLLL